MDFIRILPCLLLLVGCTGNAPDAGDGGTLAEPMLPWKGVSVRLVVAADAPLAEAIGRVRGEWQAATGAELDGFEVSESELLGDEPPQADCLIYPAYNLGVLTERGWLRPLSENDLSGDDLAWGEIFEADRTGVATWGPSTYAFPLGSPVLLCGYRHDLLKKIGRAPPATWAEYEALAAILADRDQLGDAALPADAAWSGTIEPLAEGWAGLTLLARAAAYAKHRNQISTLFDMESMEPLIAGEPFVRALDELIAACKHMPDEALRASPEQAHEALISGRCGMALTWTAAGYATADDEGGGETGRGALEIGFSVLPGAPQAYDTKAGHWEARRDDEPHHVPLVGISGRLGSVTAQAAHAEAALDLLRWLSGPVWSPRVSTASSAATLFRQSHIEANAPWADPRLGAAAALAYAEAAENSLSAAEIFGAPRIPGRERYLAALDLAVREAISGNVASQPALESAAEEWRKITAEAGVETQRAAYRRSLGLR